MMSKERARSILNVAPESANHTIRANYRALAKKWHPDRNPNDPEAERMIRLVNEARDVLLPFTAKRTRVSRAPDPPPPPRPKKKAPRESGGCRFEGRTGKLIDRWGVVLGVDRRGAGLYDVRLRSETSVEKLSFKIANASLARVVASAEWIAEKTIRIGVRKHNSRTAHVDVDVLGVEVNW